MAIPRLMWVTQDRLLYAGLLGSPSMRTMGCFCIYIATEGHVRVQLHQGSGKSGRAVTVPPYTRHQITAEASDICVVQIEAETVAPHGLSGALAMALVRDDQRALNGLARQILANIQGLAAADLQSFDFDQALFQVALAPRPMDTRIEEVLRSIKSDPAASADAARYAMACGLSFSRFLHVFKEQTGASFRALRTWKRARNWMHYVKDCANLSHVAQDTGYPDSTHFSHTIRQVYGLTPRDILAGSRRLALHSRP